MSNRFYKSYYCFVVIIFLEVLNFMKLLLFWVFYRQYISHTYQKNPQLGEMDYRSQIDWLLADSYGWTPGIMKQLESQGHEVEILFVNVEPLQRAWARENGVTFDVQNWQFEIPYEQVKRFKPDVLWVGAMFQYFGEYMQRLQPHCRKIFAWIASPLPKSIDLAAVDCVLTSHSNFKETFERQGQTCEKILPAFDQRILTKLKQPVPTDIGCSFVGNLSWAHIQRIHAMRQLVDHTPLQIWGNRSHLISRGLTQRGFIPAYLTARSLKSRINPGVWGLEMYTVLARSAMTVNVHGEVANGLAGNMRMFEATGMGTMLITEDAPNIKELYAPDEEVVTYRSTEHLIDIINYYTNHTQECMEIAAAGQKRTLTAHSLIQRGPELAALFESYLA
jgi:spore maturation protein CgeB